MPVFTAAATQTAAATTASPASLATPVTGVTAVRALRVPGLGARASRADLAALATYARTHAGAPQGVLVVPIEAPPTAGTAAVAGAMAGPNAEPGAGLVWKVPKLFAPLAADAARRHELETTLGVTAGDLLVFVSGEALTTCHILGKLRTYLAKVCQQKGLLQLDPFDYRFLWVVDFPLFQQVEQPGPETGMPFVCWCA